MEILKSKIFIGVIAALVLGVAAVCVFYFWKPPQESCEAFTPLALQKFEFDTSGEEKVLYGEKCAIINANGITDGFVITLTHKDVEAAKTTEEFIEDVTPGENREINGLTWIISEGHSSIFWQNQGVLKIIFLKSAEEDRVKTELRKFN